MADMKQILILITTAEDNMNVQLKDITVTARDGRVSHLDQVYIRGSHVRFFIVPDMLRYASSLNLYLQGIAPLYIQQHIGSS
jgi:LSM domain